MHGGCGGSEWVSEALDESCVSHKAWIPLWWQRNIRAGVQWFRKKKIHCFLPESPEPSHWTRTQQNMTKRTKLPVRVLIPCRFSQRFLAFWCFLVASQDGVYFYGDRAYQPLGLKLLGLALETYAETLWDRDPSICVDFVVTTIAMIDHDQSTWTSCEDPNGFHMNSRLHSGMRFGRRILNGLAKLRLAVGSSSERKDLYKCVH